MAVGRSYTQETIKLLYAEAAGCCSFPDCRQELVYEIKDGSKKQIGEIAHIVGKSADGPRGDSSYPQDKIDDYENLILLCRTHHGIIDLDVDKYTIEKLKDMKENHENWAKNCRSEDMINVGFPELDDIANVLMTSETLPANPSFKVITPEKKIKKNNLTRAVQYLIVMGIARSNDVKEYIENKSIYDTKFPDRLIKGFTDEYDRLYFQEGLRGDELFLTMLDFASSNEEKGLRWAAGLAILSHFFEFCEVFEK